MEPITIKEAELFDREKYEQEQNRKREEMICDIVSSINRIIEISLPEIKKGPVIRRIEIIYPREIYSEVAKLYQDFTVSHYLFDDAISIKLASHEWNVVSRVVYNEPYFETKKTFFQKLFS